MNRNMQYYIQLLTVVLLLLPSCVHHPDVPPSATKANSLPAIYPDYCNVTIPCNIAPLNFMLSVKEYDECIARITTPDGQQQTYSNGVKVQIPENEWHTMLNNAKGKSIKLEIWGRKGNKWIAFNPFDINVAEEPIDDYISYRLIEPSYIVYDYMEITQRNLTSFEESQIFNNRATCDSPKGQCINCHSYQNYKTDNMLFHVRVANGGTVIVNDGKVSKVDLKRDFTISSGVYPSWHPSAKLIAFSTNSTHQVFHTTDPNKVEVFDTESDLILYDINTESVSIISADSDLLEVFPTWSPDGKWLYYCKSVPLPEELQSEDNDIRTLYHKIQYNLYRRSFDISSYKFGEEELVYDAAIQDKSISLPRISPDGRYILFTEGRYGCFQIWHHDADIVCIPLPQDSAIVEKSSALDLTPLNSVGQSDSYPSWSSNGHWIMIASRRDDGNYSRIYFSYFNNGKVGKAFLLPQEDPEHNTFRLKSYNRPEFMVESVRTTVKEFSRVFDK